MSTVCRRAVAAEGLATTEPKWPYDGGFTLCHVCQPRLHVWVVGSPRNISGHMKDKCTQRPSVRSSSSTSTRLLRKTCSLVVGLWRSSYVLLRVSASPAWLPVQTVTASALRSLSPMCESSVDFWLCPDLALAVNGKNLGKWTSRRKCSVSLPFLVIINS